MNYYLEVDKEFMSNVEKYDTKEQFIMVALRSFANNPTGSAMVSLKDLLSILSLGSDNKNKTSLKETLTSMEDKGMIEIYEDMMKKSKIDAVDMKPADTYFFSLSTVSDARCVFKDNESMKTSFKKLSYEELFKFINMDDRGKHIAFSIYFNITKRIFEGDTQHKVSNPSIKTLVEETGLDKKTITKYIKLLKEYELIDYRTVREAEDKTKNYYCMWEHKEMIEEHIQSLKGIYESKRESA